MNGLKQNAKSLLTPVSDIDFYPVSCGTFQFALHGSSNNRVSKVALHFVYRHLAFGVVKKHKRVPLVTMMNCSSFPGEPSIQDPPVLVEETAASTD